MQQEPDASQTGRLTVPDAATQREVMRLWRQVVELDRQHNARKPPGNGTPNRHG